MKTLMNIHEWLPTKLINFFIYFFRDRIRTAINVLGDSYGAGIVAHLSRQELAIQVDQQLELNEIEDSGKEPFDKVDNEIEDNNDPKDPGNSETIYPSIS
jgi:hypothetical protein